MTINEKLSKIQAELHVAKKRRNNFGNYNFRSAEDILEALKPYNEKYGVFVTIKEKMMSDVLMRSTAVISDFEGNSVKATAFVTVDMGMKGMAAPQKFGAASSYAKKYALGNLFLIDDTADADATNTHNKVVVSQKRNAPVKKAKLTLVADSENFNRVVKVLKDKIATMAQIETKYIISDEVKAKINTLVNA